MLVVEDEFEVPRNLPTGARIPEFVFRQLIDYALTQIRENIDLPDNNLIDELFAHHDADIRKLIKDFVRQTKKISCVVNYPHASIGLPFVAIITGSEPEADQYSFMGDVMGESVIGGQRRQQYGVGLKPTLSVYIAALDPNIAMFLYQIVRYVLFANKQQLTRYYDIHNLVLNGGDLQHDEKFYPTFCFMKMITAQFITVFDYNVKPDTEAKILLNLRVARAGSDAAPVDVPGDD